MTLIVGELRKLLEQQPHSQPVEFDGVTYRQRRLTFFRVKHRGETLVHIELNELEDRENAAVPEEACELLVGELLDSLAGYQATCEVTFGSTIDAVPLQFREAETAFVIRLEQNQRPKYRVAQASLTGDEGLPGQIQLMPVDDE